MTLHLGETINDIDQLSTATVTHFWFGDTESELRPSGRGADWMLYTGDTPRAHIRHLFRGYEALPLNPREESIIDPDWRALVERVLGGELD